MKKMMNKTLIFLPLICFHALAMEGSALKLDQREIKKRNIEFKKKIRDVAKKAGSGDIVGNGAGVIENNFAFSMVQIKGLESPCVELDICFLNQKDKKVLKEIIELSKAKTNKNDLVFVPKKYNEIFQDEQDRIAVTGFSKDFPIYLNLTKIYEQESLSRNIPWQVSLLIHELGHQIGIASHSYLDGLASSIRYVLKKNLQVYPYKKFDLEIIGLSSMEDMGESKLLINTKSEALNLSKYLKRNMRCSGLRSPIGFSIENGHWKRAIENESQVLLSFDFWADLTCFNSQGIIKEEHDYSLKLELSPKENLKIKRVNLKQEKI